MPKRTKVKIRCANVRPLMAIFFEIMSNNYQNVGG